MNPTYEFDDHVALVTGAAGGMGLDTARAFAAAGAAVVLADIDGDAAHSAADELKDAGYDALGLTCDVAEYPSASLRKSWFSFLCWSVKEEVRRPQMPGELLPECEAFDTALISVDRLRWSEMTGFYTLNANFTPRRPRESLNRSRGGRLGKQAALG